jgi:DNA-binding CsgD family transcriptional regulator
VVEILARATACCCGLEHLTDREIEVLCAVAAGRTNKQIARLLNISEHTVHRHMTAMLRRAGEKSRTGLVSRTCRSGILVLGEQEPSWTGRRCLQSVASPEQFRLLSIPSVTLVAGFAVAPCYS